MSKKINLIGQQFGYWTVISEAPSNARGESMWHCKCKCGKEKDVLGYTLRKGKSQSCGCLQKEIVSKNHFIDITGKKFGHLTAIKYIGKDKSNKSIWECKCDCPAETIIQVRSADLLSGKTISCGCVKSLGEEKISKLLFQANIPFVKEKTFETCRFPQTNALLRFDFYVNNKYLIEYDGIQHSKPTFGIDNFNNTLIRDKYKDKWCKDNNIPLIRIDYKQIDTLKLEDLIL